MTSAWPLWMSKDRALIPSHTQQARPEEATSTLSLSRLRRVLEMEGPESLGDDELLSCILGRGNEGMSPLLYARSLLEKVGSVTMLSRLGVAGLDLNPGLGKSQATRLVAAFELGRRAAREATRVTMLTPLTHERVIAWALPRLAGLEHEEVWVLCVDARTNLRSTKQVGRGGVHGCGLLARDILTPVVREGASGFVLVHNHPSGDPTPSPEDIDLTRALSAAASAVCIPLLDHVVVARGGGRSLFELGMLG
jgi:DNA repair protein RadC